MSESEFIAAARTSLQPAAVVLLTALLGACKHALVNEGGGDNGTTSTATGGTDGGTGSDDGAVTGTIVDVHVTDDGPQNRVPALTLEAIAQDNEGEFSTYQGTLHGDGSFVIPGVPNGPYYLSMPPAPDQGPLALQSFLVTTTRSLDLGSMIGGRDDILQAAKPTFLSFQATGMSPWQASDYVQFYSLGPQVELLYGGLNVGDTTLDGDLDWSQGTRHGLIDGAKGDRLFITQLRTKSFAGYPYQSINKVFVPEAFTQMDGQASFVTGTFDDVPQQQVAITLKCAAFNEMVADVNPNAEVNFRQVAVMAAPGGNSLSPVLAWPPSSLSCDSDLDLTFDYGNPFPVAWNVTGVAQVSYSVSFTVPGTQAERTKIGYVVHGAPINAFSSAAVAPLVGPPTTLTINGQNGYSDRFGVGTTPTVAWSAPTVGVPAAYWVEVHRLDAADAMKAATSVAQIGTTATSVRLPPGILAKGSYYYLVVTSTTTFDPARPNRPGNSALPFAIAQGLTGTLTP